MPTILQLDTKTMLRISPKDARQLESSVNQGRSWLPYSLHTNFNFIELSENGKELLAVTDHGLYYSLNKGRSWIFRHK